MWAEKNRPANSSDDWTLVITCAWHYHKSQTADNTWAENYWKITRHYTTHACCYNRKTGLNLIVCHFEITVHIGHHTHKWNLNIKIKHGIWHSIIANKLCDKLSQEGDKNPYILFTIILLVFDTLNLVMLCLPMEIIYAYMNVWSCYGSVDKTTDSQSWGSQLESAGSSALGQGTLSSLPSPSVRT